MAAKNVLARQWVAVAGCLLTSCANPPEVAPSGRDRAHLPASEFDTLLREIDRRHDHESVAFLRTRTTKGTTPDHGPWTDQWIVREDGTWLRRTSDHVWGQSASRWWMASRRSGDSLALPTKSAGLRVAAEARPFGEEFPLDPVFAQRYEVESAWGHPDGSYSVVLRPTEQQSVWWDVSEEVGERVHESLSSLKLRVDATLLLQRTERETVSGAKMVTMFEDVRFDGERFHDPCCEPREPSEAWAAEFKPWRPGSDASD